MRTGGCIAATEEGADRRESGGMDESSLNSGESARMQEWN